MLTLLLLDLDLSTYLLNNHLSLLSCSKLLIYSCKSVQKLTKSKVRVISNNAVSTFLIKVQQSAINRKSLNPFSFKMAPFFHLGRPVVPSIW